MWGSQVRYVVKISHFVCCEKKAKRKQLQPGFCSIVHIFIDSSRGRAALASVNMHSVWSLMGWRKFNQVFVRTWVPQLCGRPSNFPVFPSFPTNFRQVTLRHKCHPNNSLLCLFSDSGQKCSSVGDNVSLVSLLSDLMSQHVSWHGKHDSRLTFRWTTVTVRQNIFAAEACR